MSVATGRVPQEMTEAWRICSQLLSYNITPNFAVSHLVLRPAAMWDQFSEVRLNWLRRGRESVSMLENDNPTRGQTCTLY